MLLMCRQLRLGPCLLRGLRRGLVRTGQAGEQIRKLVCGRPRMLRLQALGLFREGLATKDVGGARRLLRLPLWR